MPVPSNIILPNHDFLCERTSGSSLLVPWSAAERNGHKNEYLGKGIGKAPLQRLAQIAMEQGCGRLGRSCLNGNRPGIGFCLPLNATPMDQWTAYRFTGETLRRMADG